MGFCAVYVRVSTEDQAQRGTSLRDQEERCRQRAKERGFAPEDVRIAADEGFSGDDFSRPGLTKLREWIRRGAVERVIILDPDRFSRNLSQQLLVTDEILRAGIELEFINFEWRDTPEGRLFYALRGAISEYEKFKIKERSVRGRLQKAKQGLLCGDPRLYGYRYDVDRDFIFPDGKEADVVRWIFGQSDSGESCGAIARRLAEVGIAAPRGPRWHAATVARILRNRSYTGVYELYKTDVHTGKFRVREPADRFTVRIEPLVDAELFRRVQAAVAANRRFSGRPAPPGSRYLLRGLIHCGVCGSGVTGGARTRTRRSYYACPARRRAPDSGMAGGGARCGLPYFRRDLLDQAVWDAVRELLARPPDAAFFAGEGASQRAREAEIAERASVQLREARRRLRSLYLRDFVGEAEFLREDRDFRERLGRLETRLAELRECGRPRSGSGGFCAGRPEPGTGRPDAPGSGRLEALRALYERRLGNLPEEGKMRLLRSVLSKVEVYPDRRVVLHRRFET